MEIRIGIVNSPRELSFEASGTATEIESTIAAALDSKATYLKLTDVAGKVYIVPAVSLSYVEVGAEKTRRVGFVA